MREEKLPPHEWLVVCTIIGILSLLTAISYLNRDPPLPTFSENYDIQIEISGAVQSPGQYLVKKGTPVREALALAKPLPKAYLKKVKLDSPITRARKIHIKEIPMIEITIEGDKSYKIPRGTRMNELHNFINIKPLAKKRYLRNGELISLDE